MGSRLPISALLIAGVAACGAEEIQELTVIANSKSETAQEADLPDDPAMLATTDGPPLGIVQMAVRVYARPDPRSEALGYLRVGTRVTRAEKPAAFDACQGGYYNILPRGYVCAGEGATTDMNHPILRAELRGADRSYALPYTYAFVRAIAPRYYRLPSVREQFKHEMSLERHLRSYKRLREKWNGIDVGSNDVPIDDIGRVIGEVPLEPPEFSTNEKFGGRPDAEIPWFFQDGRQIPNVSNFKVPDYAVITNRIKRHAGIALIDAFGGDERHFGLTTDLRLIPTSKLKPGRGSTFHGVELTKGGWRLPMGFVKQHDRGYIYDFKKGQWKRRKKRERMAYGAPIQLTGEVRKNGKRRMVELDNGSWMRTADLAIAPLLSKLPKISKENVKWIDVSIQRQIVLLYEGTTPVYATMASTGKDGLGDPGKTHSTPRGTFRIRDKHVTNTMDSDVLGERFELNDVPYVQYFRAGYAIHAAYWHTDYGRPRSHGCINMSPIDAHRIFNWTEPRVPDKWHVVNAGETFGEGTYVHVHP